MWGWKHGLWPTFDPLFEKLLPLTVGRGVAALIAYLDSIESCRADMCRVAIGSRNLDAEMARSLLASFGIHDCLNGHGDCDGRECRGQCDGTGWYYYADLLDPPTEPSPGYSFAFTEVIRPLSRWWVATSVNRRELPLWRRPFPPKSEMCWYCKICSKTNMSDDGHPRCDSCRQYNLPPVLAETAP